MIDLSLNQDVVSEYFTSFQAFNSYKGNGNEQRLPFGPSCNDWVSWRDFWEPATSNTKFRIANNCEECLTATLAPLYDENVAYYMTNYYFCLGKMHGENECARDESGVAYDYTYNTGNKTTSMCNICDLVENGKDIWLECAALQLSADTIADHYSHDMSLLDQYISIQPSVSEDRSYCTCYKPLKNEITTYMVGKNELPKVSITYKEYLPSPLTIDTNIMWETVEIEDNDCSKKYYWSNKDFRDGTLKITVCGEYILTENIQISFNAPSADVQASDDFSPNSIDVEDLYWFPTTAQQDSDEYPGADAFHGIYQFGFFAAISIQTDDVIINLNGFEIKTEKKFYLQQRFFAIIELGDRNFIRDQGPALDLGKGFIQVSNIVIKDGTIGRVSHHGIHGNGATNIDISNLKITNFDVAGIQLNGCVNVTITDVVVGPQSSHIPVVGRYVHGRAILPRMRYFVDLFGDEIIPFGDNNIHKESKTVNELVQNLIMQMDLIYFYIINGEMHDENDADWIAAQSLFLNKNGWLDAGSAYGILINGHGTAVTSLGRREDQVSNVILEDVEIFGIALSAEERFYATPVSVFGYNIHGFCFDTLDWISITNAEDGRYIGDAYTDLVFAANELKISDLCFLNTLFVTPLLEWVFTDDQTIKVNKSGGSDVQSHDAKGVIGLRVDQAQGFKATNVYVHDITNYGALGNTECCGEWNMISFLHYTYIDLEPGYTGTRAHGILVDFIQGSFTDVVIENIESHFGSAIGMSLYKGSEIRKLENIDISNINAGSKLKTEEADALTLPNMVPFVCSLEFGPNTDEPSDLYPIVIHNMDEDSIVGRNIIGHSICVDDQLVGSIVNDEIEHHSSGVMGYVHYLSSLPVNEYYGWVFSLFALLLILGTIYFCRKWRMNSIVKGKYESYGAVNFHSNI